MLPEHWWGLIELLLVFGVVMAWALWQWWDWRRWRRSRRDLPAEQEPDK